jgi:hypothetical protein
MTDTMTSQNIDLPSRSWAGGKDNTGRPSQTTKMALSRKPFGIGHMFIWSFLLRMTDTMTSQNIVLSSWDTLYVNYLTTLKSTSLTAYMHKFSDLVCLTKYSD